MHIPREQRLARASFWSRDARLTVDISWVFAVADLLQQRKASEMEQLALLAVTSEVVSGAESTRSE
jgi:hypothetical protein